LRGAGEHLENLAAGFGGVCGCVPDSFGDGDVGAEIHKSMKALKYENILS
jgi:hypothetical protein